MKDNGEMLIRGKDGKIQKPEFDQFGQPFIRNAKGEKVYVNKNQPVSMKVLTNENGEPYIVDKNGKRVVVKTDKNGNQYVIGENGQKVLIAPSTEKKQS